MISYQERKDWLIREAALADAEVNGCMDAAILDEPRKVYQSEAFQQRYEQGFWDGKAAIAQDHQDQVTA